MTALAASDSKPAPLGALIQAGKQQLAMRLPQRRDAAGRRLPRIQVPASGQSAPQPGSAPHRLPLYQRPGSVVLLDDAPDYLEMLAASLPRHWNVETFVNPRECVSYLQQEPARWEADLRAQQRIVENWHHGEPLVRQILDYWASEKERYALTKVCVVDQRMPGMTGLQALEQLADWPGRRILLTGDFDEGLATQAFNRGLIDQFITKQTDRMGVCLAEAIQLLMDRPDARYHQIWSATLRPQQLAILREPSVAQDLANFASRTFAEWVVIGEPFGVLGLSDSGLAFWVQLEPTEGLEELATLAAERGASPEDVSHIRAGRCVYDGRLLEALGRRRPPSVTPAFYVGDAGIVIAAIHRIDVEPGGPVAVSYTDWMALNAQRRSMNQSRY